MAIFTMAVLAAINITSGSVQATLDAREVSEATWLLQQKMVALETKLETEGIEKACEKKDEGKFEAPNEKYTWSTSCDEVDFQLSETAAKMAAAEGEETEKSSTENQLLKFILKTAGEYLTKSLREIHVEVEWTSGKKKRSVDATTHFARYDQKLTLGGIDTSGGTGGGGADTGKGASSP